MQLQLQATAALARPSPAHAALALASTCPATSHAIPSTPVRPATTAHRLISGSANENSARGSARGSGGSSSGDTTQQQAGSARTGTQEGTAADPSTPATSSASTPATTPASTPQYPVVVGRKRRVQLQQPTSALPTALPAAVPAAVTAPLLPLIRSSSSQLLLSAIMGAAASNNNSSTGSNSNSNNDNSSNSSNDNGSKSSNSSNSSANDSNDGNDDASANHSSSSNNNHSSSSSSSSSSSNNNSNSIDNNHNNSNNINNNNHSSSSSGSGSGSSSGSGSGSGSGSRNPYEYSSPLRPHSAVSSASGSGCDSSARMGGGAGGSGGGGIGASGSGSGGDRRNGVSVLSYSPQKENGKEEEKGKGKGRERMQGRERASEHDGKKPKVVKFVLDFSDHKSSTSVDSGSDSGSDWLQGSSALSGTIENNTSSSSSSSSSSGSVAISSASNGSSDGGSSSNGSGSDHTSSSNSSNGGAPRGKGGSRPDHSKPSGRGGGGAGKGKGQSRRPCGEGDEGEEGGEGEDDQWERTAGAASKKAKKSPPAGGAHWVVVGGQALLLVLLCGAGLLFAGLAGPGPGRWLAQLYLGPACYPLTATVLRELATSPPAVPPRRDDHRHGQGYGQGGSGGQGQGPSGSVLPADFFDRLTGPQAAARLSHIDRELDALRFTGVFYTPSREQRSETAHTTSLGGGAGYEEYLAHATTTAMTATAALETDVDGETPTPTQIQTQTRVTSTIPPPTQLHTLMLGPRPGLPTRIPKVQWELRGSLLGDFFRRQVRMRIVLHVQLDGRKLSFPTGDRVDVEADGGAIQLTFSLQDQGVLPGVHEVSVSAVFVVPTPLPTPTFEGVSVAGREGSRGVQDDSQLSTSEPESQTWSGSGSESWSESEASRAALEWDCLDMGQQHCTHYVLPAATVRFYYAPSDHPLYAHETAVVGQAVEQRRRRYDTHHQARTAAPPLGEIPPPPLPPSTPLSPPATARADALTRTIGSDGTTAMAGAVGLPVAGEVGVGGEGSSAAVAAGREGTEGREAREMRERDRAAAAKRLEFDPFVRSGAGSSTGSGTGTGTGSTAGLSSPTATRQQSATTSAATTPTTPTAATRTDAPTDRQVGGHRGGQGHLFSTKGLSIVSPEPEQRLPMPQRPTTTPDSAQSQPLQTVLQLVVSLPRRLCAYPAPSSPTSSPSPLSLRTGSLRLQLTHRFLGAVGAGTSSSPNTSTVYDTTAIALTNFDKASRSGNNSSTNFLLTIDVQGLTVGAHAVSVAVVRADHGDATDATNAPVGGWPKGTAVVYSDAVRFYAEEGV